MLVVVLYFVPVCVYLISYLFVCIWFRTCWCVFDFVPVCVYLNSYLFVCSWHRSCLFVLDFVPDDVYLILYLFVCTLFRTCLCVLYFVPVCVYLISYLFVCTFFVPVCVYLISYLFVCTWFRTCWCVFYFVPICVLSCISCNSFRVPLRILAANESNWLIYSTSTNVLIARGPEFIISISTMHIWSSLPEYFFSISSNILELNTSLSINISLTSSISKFSRISIRLLEIFGLNICGSKVKSIDQCFNSKNINNKNIGIKVSTHDAFLELPSPGTLNIKIFKI